MKFILIAALLMSGCTKAGESVSLEDLQIKAMAAALTDKKYICYKILKGAFEGNEFCITYIPKESEK